VAPAFNISKRLSGAFLVISRFNLLPLVELQQTNTRALARDGMAQPPPRTAEHELDPWVLSAMAATMADEEEGAIFRRFDDFNLLNLLILQDNVQRLSKEFSTLCPEMTADPDPNPAWYAMSLPLEGRNAHASQKEEDQREEKRRKVWAQLREKLREYSKAASPSGLHSRDAVKANGSASLPRQCSN
jgi:hypothetical protein